MRNEVDNEKIIIIIIIIIIHSDKTSRNTITNP